LGLKRWMQFARRTLQSSCKICENLGYPEGHELPDI
jgi:hypothetical protein